VINAGEYGQASGFDGGLKPIHRLPGSKAAGNGGQSIDHRRPCSIAEQQSTQPNQFPHLDESSIFWRVAFACDG
jgi:hypothetical protein